MMKQVYTKEFYTDQQDTSLDSAREIVPFVMDYIHPKSVADVGCGVGTWLSVFQQHGVSEILGLDGHWVRKDMLFIPETDFVGMDFNTPILVDKTYDLVVSLEVAEHLPIEQSEMFIQSLTSMGDVILFAAAIPLQGGKYHVNEQWLDFWTELFLKNGFVPVDCIRRKIWHNDYIAWHYAQNIVFFVRESALDNYPKLKQERKNGNDNALSLIHPKNYLRIVNTYKGKMKYKRLAMIFLLASIILSISIIIR